MYRTRLVAAVAAALALGALAAASAPAATTALGGNPLNVYVGDLGQLQAFRAGETSGLYYHPLRHEGMPGCSWPSVRAGRCTASTARPGRTVSPTTRS